MNRDKTRFEDFSDEELDAVREGARSLAVEAELKIRLARYQLAIAEEEVEWRKSKKPKRLTEDWERFWNNEVEDVAKTCRVSLGYVAEIALRLAKET